MMRFTCSLLIALLIVSNANSQQPLRGADVPDYAQQATPGGGQQAVPRNQTDPRALQMRQQQQLLQQQQIQQQRLLQQQQAANGGQNPAAQNPAAQRNPAAQQNIPGQQQRAVAPPVNPNVAPFAPLPPKELARLQQLLQAWQTQSQGTKTLVCNFRKWHFDLLAAPAGVYATKSSGEIRYRSPDKGMFREDELLFYKGMKEGKPQHAPEPGKVGDYWVCSGTEVIEFDGTEKKCTIMELPKAMQGTEIFNSPLPFVFNLDAEKIQQRYWVREVKAPEEGMYLIEAWPKMQNDRAQYKLVQIALDQKTFLPKALLMYAPNFNAKTAPVWDHYEFTNLGRNTIRAKMQDFMKSFLPRRPPTDWQVVREKFPVEQARQPQQAANPNAQPVR